jgi:hypothetical protein
MTHHSQSTSMYNRVGMECAEEEHQRDGQQGWLRACVCVRVCVCVCDVRACVCLHVSFAFEPLVVVEPKLICGRALHRSTLATSNILSSSCFRRTLFEVVVYFAAL